MARKKPKQEEASLIGFLSTVFILYCVYIVILFLSGDKHRFWSHIIYLILFLSSIVLSIFVVKKIKAKEKKNLLQKIKENNLEEHIKNFISRFCLGQEKSNDAWKYRTYGVTYDRISDLKKFLEQSNLRVSIKQIEIILSEYIDQRELELTFKSIESNTFEFSKLSGQQFEGLLYRLFEKSGYTVQHIGKSGDQGGDLIITKDRTRTLVQAKRYSNNVPNSAIQEAVAAKKYYDCHLAMVVTSSNFTKEAAILAKANDVQLIEKHELQMLLANNLNESWS